MTIPEVAKRLGCSNNTVYKYIKAGQIEITRNDGGHPANKIDVSEESLQAFNAIMPNLLTKEDVAKLKGVSCRTVEAWVLKGKIKPVAKFLKKNYYRKEDVE